MYFTTVFNNLLWTIFISLKWLDKRNYDLFIVAIRLIKHIKFIRIHLIPLLLAIWSPTKLTLAATNEANNSDGVWQSSMSLGRRIPRSPPLACLDLCAPRRQCDWLWLWLQLWALAVPLGHSSGATTIANSNRRGDRNKTTTFMAATWAEELTTTIIKWWQ